MELSPTRASQAGLKRLIRGLAFGLVLLIAASVVAVIALVGSPDDDVETIRTIVGAVSSESVEVTNGYFETAEASGSMVARSFADGSGEIDSEILQSAMRNVVAANGNIDGAFVGWPNGDFLYVTESLAELDDGFRIKRIVNAESRVVSEQQTDSAFVVVGESDLVADNFDPRDRPWYAQALDRESGWTVPYEFASSGMPGITQFQAVELDGSLGTTETPDAVVGIDVRLDELTSFLEERQPSENGFAAIVDDTGEIVAGSRPDLEPERLEELASLSAGAGPGEIREATIESRGTSLVVALARIGAEAEWTLAVAAPESDFLTGVRGSVHVVLPVVGLLLAGGVILLAISGIRRTERLHVRATTDPLTGVLNRSEFRQRLDERLVGDPDIDLAIVAIDVDDFGSVNDTWGHAEGDLLLVGFAKRLRSSVGSRGFVGRVGGDEFMIALELGPGDDAHRVIVDMLAETTREPLAMGQSALDLNVSSGYCLRRAGVRVPLLDLLRNADLALITAKVNGSGVLAFDSKMALPSARDTELRGELLVAIERDEFEVHFQPEVDLETGTIVGAEALLRRRDAGGNLLPAESFIHDLERLNVLGRLTSFVIDSARELAEQVGQADFTVRVNMSSDELCAEGSLDVLARANSTTATRWCIEITERTIVDAPARILRRLEQLVAAGVELALDDFGTGYSSLSELATLPVTMIKIDRSFVGSLTLENAPSSVASVVVDTADRLNLDVVAEGVSTEQQRAALIAMGCRRGQGYLFAPAISRDDLLDSLSRRPSRSGSRSGSDPNRVAD